jgi:hypothetical protein
MSICVCVSKKISKHWLPMQIVCTLWNERWTGNLGAPALQNFHRVATMSVDCVIRLRNTLVFWQQGWTQVLRQMGVTVIVLV